MITSLITPVYFRYVLLSINNQFMQVHNKVNITFLIYKLTKSSLLIRQIKSAYYRFVLLSIITKLICYYIPSNSAN